MNWLTSFFEWLVGKSKLKPQWIVKTQAATVQACGFLPMAESIIGVVAAGNPAAVSAVSVAKYICNNITKPEEETAQIQTLVGGVSEPTTVEAGNIKGVPIQGVFLK